MDLVEKEIASKRVFDGNLLHVRSDTVLLPNGNESTREWIDHPGAAAVVALLPDDRIVLVRQYRYPVRREFVEVPAGKFDRAGETPIAVAHRELREETGWIASRMIPLGPIHVAVGYSNEVIHCFLATDLEMTTAEPDADEFLEPVYIPFSEALEMIDDGRITDAKTVVSILLVERRRLRKVH